MFVTLKQFQLCIIILIFGFHLQESMSKRHSVLFIFIDDLRHLDDKEVHLPNIKKMAASSVNFKHSFAQVCVI